MTYCKDCQHFLDDHSGVFGPGPICLKTKDADMVDGRVIYLQCRAVRHDPSKCSTCARWFQAKEVPKEILSGNTIN